MKKLRFLIIGLLLCFAASMTAQDLGKNTENMKELAQTRVELKTTLGNIVVALYNETPLHRDNFIKLVKHGYYDGVLFHRVIKDFMIQTGDGNSKMATAGQMLGDGDPGYTIPAEFVYPKYFHKRGALAAARTGDQVNPLRASSGSQFSRVPGQTYDSARVSMMEQRLMQNRKQDLFNKIAMANRERIMAARTSGDPAAMQALEKELTAQYEQELQSETLLFTPEQRQAYTTVGGTPHLDGQYTVFGEVLQGMDVVDKIQNVATGANDRPIDDVKIIKAKIIEPAQ